MGAELTGVASLTATADDIADRWTGYHEFETFTGVEHAIWMEYGTRPHSITPNTANVLRFEVNGTTVYTGQVDHPGTEPRPYMRPAAEAAVRESPAIARRVDSLEDLTESLADVVQQFAKRLAPRETGELILSIRTRQVV